MAESWAPGGVGGAVRAHGPRVSRWAARAGTVDSQHGNDGQSANAGMCGVNWWCFRSVCVFTINEHAVRCDTNLNWLPVIFD